MRPRLLIGLVLVLGVAGGAGVTRADSGFDAAVLAFQRADYDGAIARLDEAIRRGQDAARVRTLLGWSLYKKNDFARAQAEFERALRMDPNDPNAFYAREGLGWIAYKAGDYDRALAAFAESVRLSPAYPNAHDGLGWSYLAKGDLVRAQANFEAATARAPNDLDAQRGLGFVAYHRRDWALAIDRFRDLVRRNEADTLSRSALGWAHYYKGDLSAARRIFEDLARREPTWADPLAGLAWIAERQGKRDEAQARFRAAIDKSAAYVAIPDLRALLAGRPEWADLWRQLCWGLYQQHALSKAEAEFRAFLERHPDDPDALRGLGYALFMLKRYREAMPPLEQSLASGARLAPVRENVEIPGAPGLHPIVSDATSTLAWSHYYAGDLEAALTLFRDVTRKHPDWADPWSGLGWTLIKVGSRGEAERAFRQALDAKSGYPDALIGLRTLGRAP